MFCIKGYTGLFTDQCTWSNSYVQLPCHDLFVLPSHIHTCCYSQSTVFENIGGVHTHAQAYKCTRAGRSRWRYEQSLGILANHLSAIEGYLVISGMVKTQIWNRWTWTLCMPSAEVLFATYHKPGYERDLDSEGLFKIRHFQQDGTYQRLV